VLAYQVGAEFNPAWDRFFSRTFISTPRSVEDKHALYRGLTVLNKKLSSFLKLIFSDYCFLTKVLQKEISVSDLIN
jgi:hypothetical protein